ncbi:hypothetical protein HDU79_011816 [Rhizoclosmatium sp. JEL0117]|nr:hypothetical protein HDU79_011816 [Rhizoclosmatium sp. JEL0117]
MATTPSIPRLLLLLSKRDQTLATAESITAGLISAALTDIAGASKIFKGGIVAYSDEVKHDVLGVPNEILNPPGPSAVSAECAKAMAEGAARVLGTDWALATTGYAGNGRERKLLASASTSDILDELHPPNTIPNQDDGLVFIHVVGPSVSEGKMFHFDQANPRNLNRSLTLSHALNFLFELVDSVNQPTEH